MTRIFILALAGILTIISIKSVNGAELYGRFSSKHANIFDDAEAEVNCGKWEKTESIASNGKVNVRGIPGGRGCYLVIHHPNYKKSPKIQFSTRKSVVTLNAKIKIRKKDNRIIVLRR